MRRRAKMVRLHLNDGAPSVDGIFVGFKAGHYRIKKAVLVRSEGEQHALEDEAWVPRRNVLLVQTLKGVSE